MAYEHKGPAPDGGSFYNVEQAVGNNGVNAQGDVKLVQYLLRNIYDAEAGNLVVDGWIGPVTLAWIKRFQTDAKASGRKVLVDGRVDRAFAAVSGVSGTVYTIVLLNQVLKQKNPAAYGRTPAAVPLSTAPRVNPYNPKTKTVVETSRVWTGQGWKVTNRYSDGTTETTLVKGDLIENGRKYHGKVVSQTEIKLAGGAPYGTHYAYEDGYTEVVLAKEMQNHDDKRLKSVEKMRV